MEPSGEDIKLILVGVRAVGRHGVVLRVSTDSCESQSLDCLFLRRDMDICRQKDYKPRSRPSFCGLSGYEPKNMASWSTWLSLVHNSSGPWFKVPGSQGYTLYDLKNETYSTSWVKKVSKVVILVKVE